MTLYVGNVDVTTETSVKKEKTRNVYQRTYINDTNLKEKKGENG